MSSLITAGHHTALSERPERSRNAKAQARHRAKRKAYIDQLEQTVTKLLAASGFTSDQIAALPPPLLKIRELEQENARLQRENEEMRRLLSDPGARTMPLETVRRDSTAYTDTRAACDRDYLKRRKMGDIEDVYMAPNDHTGSHHNDLRPPPLTIPPQSALAHSAYSSMPSSAHSTHNDTGSTPIFNLHNPAYLPNTPSGSSSTSSPPFSASVILSF
ncbi:hypothetical protein HGRIS_012202 [Hohenbuehelia grisea]|uniref:BZIP domain-containing protein n=1 Tax=Hohenbuehelia grisea TaxID=104357 RepID=A0ABR3IRJ0_9AGAR